MPRESISTPSGASCRRPIPTSRHKKGNPFTPMCLVCRYVWFAVVFAAIPLLCRSFPAAAFSAAILSLSQCCRAVISPATAFMRLHIDAPRRASLPCCRLVPDTPARAPGALVAEYPQHRAVGLLLGEEPRIVFVVALVAVDDDVLGCRDQAVLDAAETAQRLLVGTRVEEPDVLRVACLLYTSDAADD